MKDIPNGSIDMILAIYLTELHNAKWDVIIPLNYFGKNTKG